MKPHPAIFEDQVERPLTSVDLDDWLNKIDAMTEELLRFASPVKANELRRKLETANYIVGGWIADRIRLKFPIYRTDIDRLGDAILSALAADGE